MTKGIEGGAPDAQDCVGGMCGSMSDDVVISHCWDNADADVEVWTATLRGKRVGTLRTEVLDDDWEHNFSGYIDRETWREEFPLPDTVKIDRLEVVQDMRNFGIGRRLLTSAMEDLRKRGHRQWFLNASPIDDNGLDVGQLEDFYSKGGFIVRVRRPDSTLMWFNE